jgi:hypothetical protein
MFLFLKKYIIKDVPSLDQYCKQKNVKISPVPLRETEIDIQGLPTTPCSIVLRKEYFDCPQRDSQAVHYI